MALRRAVPVFAFLLLALGVTWPLPLHLTTHLTGTPSGDTGVYVWNLWIFRHELIRHAQWPFITDHIFALTNGTELSVHNYTVFADLLALPLMGRLGVIGSFNIIYLVLIASSGYAAFVLVKRLVGGEIEALIAGAVFAASPVLIARGTAHFSLVAAAPLPVFLLCVLRALRTSRLRDALLVGFVIGWAGYSDAYYPVYCLLMGTLVVVQHQWLLGRVIESAKTRRVILLNGLLGIVLLAIAWRVWHGGAPISLLGYSISVRSLYTPVLVLTLLLLVRLQLGLQFRLTRRPSSLASTRLVRLTMVAAITAAVVLSPVLVGLGRRIVDGRFPHTPIYWRSSPPGLDVAELVLPNPNHPWFGEPEQRWITAATPLAFPEYVGSMSLVALAIIGVAMWRVRHSIPGFWLVFTLAFVLLALGPFVQVARANTYIPGPWAVLRYVPVIGLARSPSRFAIVAALGLSVMLGFALVALRRNWPGQWRVVCPVLCGFLSFELLPAPRPLFDATVPTVYSVVAQNRDESVRVLELPGGVRDGTSSLGDFNASAQYFQTVHRKPLIGGYQSRVSEQRKAANLQVPVLAALFALSERRPVSADLAARAHATSRDFLDRSCLGYVVIDSQRASAELRAFAIELFDLIEIGDDRGRELFLPAGGAPVGSCRAQPTIQ